MPWAVDLETMDITAPPGKGKFPCRGAFLIASAEQGFLRLIRDGKLNPGRYVALTPCFRDEDTLSETHHLYFMKVELIDTIRTTHEAVVDMVKSASIFFNSFLDVITVETDGSFDIVSRKHGIELGSYGLRSHPLVGDWVYGTGCAEPRLTYAVGKVQRDKFWVQPPSCSRSDQQYGP